MFLPVLSEVEYLMGGGEVMREVEREVRRNGDRPPRTSTLASQPDPIRPSQQGVTPQRLVAGAWGSLVRGVRLCASRCSLVAQPASLRATMPVAHSQRREESVRGRGCLWG